MQPFDKTPSSRFKWQHFLILSKCIRIGKEGSCPGFLLQPQTHDPAIFCTQALADGGLDVTYKKSLPF